MKLTDFAGDALTRTVAQVMMAESPLLAAAEFYPIVGNADNTRKASAATGGQFRAAGSDFSASGTTPAYATPALKIFGDNVLVDVAYERRGMDVASVRAADLLAFAKNVAREFSDAFINATVSSTAFHGLKSLVPAGQLLSSGGDDGVLRVVLGNSDAAKQAQQKFIEQLIALSGMIAGGASHLIMDSLTLARLTSIAAGHITVVRDDFGKPISFFNSIPIIDSGYDKDGNKVIGHAETLDEETTCTSVYAVRFGEKSDLSIATSNGLNVKDLGVVAANFVHKCEIDADLALLNDKAVARMQGIIL